MFRTYEGYWDDGRILPIGAPIKISSRTRVLITALNEIDGEEESEAKREKRIEEQKRFWAEFDRMAGEASSEELRIEDFPRMNFGRELATFSEVSDNEGDL